MCNWAGTTSCQSMWQEIVMWNEMFRYNKDDEANHDDVQPVPCLHRRRRNGCLRSFQWWIEDTNVSKSTEEFWCPVRRICEGWTSFQETKGSIRSACVILSKKQGFGQHAAVRHKIICVVALSAFVLSHEELCATFLDTRHGRGQLGKKTVISDGNCIHWEIGSLPWARHWDQWIFHPCTDSKPKQSRKEFVTIAAKDIIIELKIEVPFKWQRQ